MSEAKKKEEELQDEVKKENNKVNEAYIFSILEVEWVLYVKADGLVGAIPT